MELLTPPAVPTVAVLPAAGQRGRLLTLSTDGHLYHDNGVSWDDISGRHVLTAARTYYVATTGSDSNDGLAVGTPFLTIQKAIDTVAGLDTSIYNVAVNVADGTYTAGATLKTIIGAGVVTITGNTATPANAVISVAGSCVVANYYAGKYKIEGFKFISSGAVCVTANGAVVLELGTVDFGSSAQAHLLAKYGAFIDLTSAYTISGAAPYHYQAAQFACIRDINKTVTITGTPAFSAFAYSLQLGNLQLVGLTYSGSATGARYSASANAVIYTNAAGPTYLPGDAAGTTTTGGQYV